MSKAINCSEVIHLFSTVEEFWCKGTSKAK